MDNSECERDFSALNDLKTEFQSRMSHEQTAARLWWYKMKMSMTPERWSEAVQHTGHGWLKGGNTKSGTRRAHTAAAPMDGTTPTDAVTSTTPASSTTGTAAPTDAAAMPTLDELAAILSARAAAADDDDQCTNWASCQLSLLQMRRPSC